MALKNINAFEQHVEKIVLGAAAAGALVMVYLAMQTVGFEDAREGWMGPNDVEKIIARDLKDLRNQRETLEDQGMPTVKTEDYPGKYRKLASNAPLGDDFPRLPAVAFGPTNLGPSAVQGGVIMAKQESVVPDAPKPEMLRAALLQLAVADDISPDGQPVPPPAGTEWHTQVRNVVMIDGWVPVGQMVLDMVKQKDPKKQLTVPEIQRGVIYKIRVIREELQPNGTWKKEEVTPAQGSPEPAPNLLPTTMADGDLPSRLADIDTQFQWIQLPNYYVDAQGIPVTPPILSEPIPETIVNQMTTLRTEIEAAKLGATVVTPSPTVRPIIPGGTTVTPTETAMPNTVEGIRAMEVQPFTFWDDSIKPDRTYRYNVQVQMVNPGFGWAWGLEKPELKLEPRIPLKDEGFVRVPGEIVVHSDLAFFIQGSDVLGKGGISGKIYRQENGWWYSSYFSAQNGMNVATQMTVGGQSVNVDTKFAIVDSQTTGGNLHVILKDPSGALVTRDVPADWNKQERKDLDDKVKEAKAAAAAEAAAPDETGGTATPTWGGLVTPSATPTPAPGGGMPAVPVRPTAPPVPVRGTN